MMADRLTAAEIDTAAADWLAREDARALTTAEQAELEHWLGRDTRHHGAYIRLRAVSARLDLLRGQQVQNVPAWHRWGPVAAVVVLLLAAGLAWRGQPPSTPQVAAITYETAKGEMRRLTLDDGSVVEINTASRLRVAFSDGARQLWLDQGEANFQVARDPQRPFTVHTGGGTVTAVGTAFQILTDADAARVTVSEGTVSLRAGTLAAVPLTRNHEAHMTKTRIVTRAMALPDMERRASWRDGRLVFAGETLADAAAEISRYSQQRIKVDSAVAQRRVGGIFRSTDAEGFAQAVAASLQLQVTRDADGTLTLEARP